VNLNAQRRPMRPSPRQRCIARAALLAGLVLTVAHATPAEADDQDPQAVAVTILGIHATNEAEPHIAPALAAVAEQLKRYKFNSFRLVVRQTRSVALGKAWELPMRGGYCRRVRPTGTEEQRVKMEVAWVQYVKDEDGRRKERVRERMVLYLGKGKYLLTAVKMKGGALVAAVAAE